MKLTELDPRWVTGIRANWDAYGGRRGHVALSFLCPCCKTQRLVIYFTPAIDDGVLKDFATWPDITEGKIKWQRTGETFETMTLKPSIDCSKFGHWHGWITNGEVT